jgi:hypothetical protein
LFVRVHSIHTPRTVYQSRDDRASPIIPGVRSGSSTA